MRTLMQSACTDFEEYIWMHACLQADLNPFDPSPDSPYAREHYDGLIVLRRHYEKLGGRFRLIITGKKRAALAHALPRFVPANLELHEGISVAYLDGPRVVPHISVFRHGNGTFDQPSMMGTHCGQTAPTVYESFRTRG